MTEETKSRPEFDAGHVPMTEEMDSPRRTLPPLLPMLVAFVIAGAAAAIFLFATKSPQAYTCHVVKAVLFPVHTESSQTGMSYGGITELNVEKEIHDMVVILVQVNLKNTHPKDKLYIKGISAMLSTDGSDAEDLAALGSDYDRLFQAYPLLAEYRQNPIAPEMVLNPGEQITGAEIFGFQIPLADFQKSKSLTVDIALYNRNIIELPLPINQIQVITPPPPTLGAPHKHKK